MTECRARHVHTRNRNRNTGTFTPARLHEALARLEALDPDQGRLVELRFFGGLSIQEASAVMGISPATAKREWAIARAFLQRELTVGSTP